MKKGIVKYSEEFVSPIGLKSWRGIELEYDMSSEDPIEIFDNAKRIVEKSASSNHPFSGYPNLLNPDDNLPVITSKQQEPQIGITSESLMSCQDLVTIDSYRLLIKGKEDLELAYMKRRKEIVDAEANGILSKTEKSRNGASRK